MVLEADSLKNAKGVVENELSRLRIKDWEMKTTKI